MFNIPIGQVGKSLVTFATNPKTGTKVFRFASNMNANSAPICKVTIPGIVSKNYGKAYVTNFFNGKAQQVTEILTNAGENGKGQITEFSTYIRNGADQLRKKISKFSVGDNFTAYRDVDLANPQALARPNGFVITLGGKSPVAGIKSDLSHQSIQVGDKAVQVLQRGPFEFLPSQTFEFNGTQLNWGRTLG